MPTVPSDRRRAAWPARPRPCGPWARVHRESLLPVDQETGRSRGFFVASKSRAWLPSVSLLRLSLDKLRWATLANDLCVLTANAKTIEALVRAVATAVSSIGTPVELRHVGFGPLTGARAQIQPRRSGSTTQAVFVPRAVRRRLSCAQAGRDLAGPGLDLEVVQEAMQLCMDAKTHSLYAVVEAVLAGTAARPSVPCGRCGDLLLTERPRRWLRSANPCPRPREPLRPSGNPCWDPQRGRRANGALDRFPAQLTAVGVPHEGRPADRGTLRSLPGGGGGGEGSRVATVTGRPRASRFGSRSTPSESGRRACGTRSRGCGTKWPAWRVLCSARATERRPSARPAGLG